jgi:hypothetical protein
MKAAQWFIVIAVVAVFVAFARTGSPTIINTFFVRTTKRKDAPNDPANFV